MGLVKGLYVGLEVVRWLELALGLGLGLKREGW